MIHLISSCSVDCIDLPLSSMAILSTKLAVPIGFPQFQCVDSVAVIGTFAHDGSVCIHACGENSRKRFHHPGTAVVSGRRWHIRGFGSLHDYQHRVDDAHNAADGECVVSYRQYHFCDRLQQHGSHHQ